MEPISRTDQIRHDELSPDSFQMVVYDAHRQSSPSFSTALASMREEVVGRHDTIERWLASTGPEFEDGNLILANLFGCCIASYTVLAKLLHDNRGFMESDVARKLFDEFRKFYIWNDLHSTKMGSLDQMIENSSILKFPILDMSSQWANAVLRIPRVIVSQKWESISVQLDHLETAVERAKQVVGAARDQDLSGASPNLDPADGSESTSSSEDNLADIIEDMKTFTECLVDLESALDFPALDTMYESPQAPPNGEFQQLSVFEEGSLAFAMMIRERYPVAAPKFVGRLGEANLRRQRKILACHEKILNSNQQQSQARQFDQADSPGGFQARPVPISTSQLSASSSWSRGPDSIFSGAGIVENLNGDHRGLRNRSPRPGSDTSLESSSFDNTGDEVRRHVPPIPEASKDGRPFHCNICGEIQESIRSKTEWKKHVFDDIEPYVCSFENCRQGLQTYKSQRDWINHEFAVHRTSTKWHCELCFKLFDIRKNFQEHFAVEHPDKDLQLLDEHKLKTAELVIIRSAKNEICPFCDQKVAQTRKEFGSHVGKHMLETSLACIPAFCGFATESDALEHFQDSEPEQTGPTFGTSPFSDYHTLEVITGCWFEAKRADNATAKLLELRSGLRKDGNGPTLSFIKENRNLSRALRDIYDLFPIYVSRIPMMPYFLDVILPPVTTFSKIILQSFNHPWKSPRDQWDFLLAQLGASGMSPVDEVMMYKDFLLQLINLLSRSPAYDPTAFEIFRLRVFRARKLRGIPKPQGPGFSVPPQQTSLRDKAIHWASKIFDERPHSVTPLKHRRSSRCFGPPMTRELLGIPEDASVLFKLPFDKNRLSITCYLHPQGSDIWSILIRWMDRLSNTFYSCYGVQEICVSRRGASLTFRRWSISRTRSAIWAVLFMKSWEHMVILYSTFLAMKCRCPLTLSINPDEFQLSGEYTLAKMNIIDDGFEHFLHIRQDGKSGGIRLLATVKSGELEKCPVWTAFVTHQIHSPTWLERRSAHRVWIYDFKPYVFCEKYRPQRVSSGQFELYFVAVDAADAFEQIFSNSRSPSSVVSVADVGLTLESKDNSKLNNTWKGKQRAGSDGPPVEDTGAKTDEEDDYSSSVSFSDSSSSGSFSSGSSSSGSSSRSGDVDLPEPAASSTQKTEHSQSFVKASTDIISDSAVPELEQSITENDSSRPPRSLPGPTTKVHGLESGVGPRTPLNDSPAELPSNNGLSPVQAEEEPSPSRSRRLFGRRIANMLKKFRGSKSGRQDVDN